MVLGHQPVNAMEEGMQPRRVPSQPNVNTTWANMR